MFNSATAGFLWKNRDRRREEEMSGYNKESCGMNYWGFDMEGRDGLNRALKTGCSTSNTDTCTTHTFRHKHTIAGRLAWGRVNGVTQTDRQGDWATQESALPRFPTQKQTKPTRITALRPNWHVAILTKNTGDTPRVSPPFPIHFSSKSRGIPGSGNNNASIFIPWCVKVYFLGVCSPSSCRLFPCALICLAGNSPVAFPPVMRPTLWSRHSRLLFTG